MFRQIVSSVVDLIYPNVCCGCQREALALPSIFCIDCASSLPYTHMEHQKENEFEQHFIGRLYVEAGSALFHFTKKGMIQEAIHAMKYGNQPQLGYYLGRMLGQKLKPHPIYKTCDAVIGIPLHKKKKWKRGYNQADYIAKGVADTLKIPSYTQAIERRRMTSSQTRKSRTMRMRNMQAGFTVSKPELVSKKHILLVDDVLTSGATMDYCGQVILQEERTKLSMATLAMGSAI